MLKKLHHNPLRPLLLGLLICAPLSANAVTFRAEDYNAFSDTTAGNTGGVYRSDDVDIEATSDTGGGYNIGWTEAGEWLTYDNLTIPASGQYIVRARVATDTGATISLDLNGGSILLGELALPATGGWQSWQTVETQVALDAGTYSLGVYASTGGWNLNWIEIIPTGVNPSPSEQTFEAEDYNEAYDTTAGNTGGA